MFDRYSFWRLLASESCAFLGEPGVSLGLAGLGGGGGALWETQPEHAPQNLSPQEGRADRWQLCRCTGGPSTLGMGGVRVQMCMLLYFQKKKKKEREKKTNMVEMVSFPFSSFFFF